MSATSREDGIAYYRRMADGRLEHPQLLSFFNGAYDRLLAAFAASGDLSRESKGNAREQIVREALSNVLPPFVRLEAGDIIDSEGRQSGQLDSVAIDDRSPTLRVGRDANGFILAEGALAVVELKADLSKQWSELQTLFRQLAPVQPYTWRVSHGGHVDAFVPLFVVAADGWATEEKAVEHLGELAEAVARALNGTHRAATEAKKKSAEVYRAEIRALEEKEDRLFDRFDGGEIDRCAGQNARSQRLASLRG